MVLVPGTEMECYIEKNYFHWENLRKPLEPFICDFKSLLGMEGKRISPSLSGFLVLVD